MKYTLKLALAAAAGLALASSTRAAGVYSGDLIIGFTTASGSDLEYDLGKFASLTDGETFSALTTLINSHFAGGLASVNWGVIGNTLNGIGSTANNTVYVTTGNTSLTPPTANQSTYNAVFGQAKNIYTLFPTGAGSGSSATPSSTLANSWNSQTLNPSLSTQYKNAYTDPNVLGPNSDVLWGVNTQGGATTELGTFTLGANGSLTFNSVAVPEPATYGAIAGAGLLLLSLRRQLTFKV